MAIFKCTFLFNGPTGPGAGGGASTETRVAGWSESLYLSATNVTVSTPQVLAFLNRRSLLLPDNSRITGVRIADVSAVGKAQLFAVNYPGPGGRPTDYPSIALLCTAGTSAGNNVRRFTIRSIPDDQVTFGEFTPDAGYLANLTNFFNIGLNGWSFKALDLSTANLPIVDITTGGLLTSTALYPGIAVGDEIRIYKTVPGATFQKTSLNATVLNFLPLTNQIQLLNWKLGACEGGSYRKLTYFYPPIDVTTVVASRIVTRKVGRPSIGFRGRRSKRRVM